MSQVIPALNWFDRSCISETFFSCFLWVGMGGVCYCLLVETFLITSDKSFVGLGSFSAL